MQHVNVNEQQAAKRIFAFAAASAAAASFLLYRCRCDFFTVKHLVFHRPVA